MTITPSTLAARGSRVSPCTAPTAWRRVLSAAILFVAGVNLAIAAPAVNTLEKNGLFGHEPNGVAIRGYDPVAYFTEGAPVEGSDEFSTEWNGASWHFASQEHLELFADDPERYAPQYGGYCAYGVAQGYLVKIDPDRWTIVDGKLYLNYDEGVQRKWEDDIPGFVATADDRIDALLAAP